MDEPLWAKAWKYGYAKVLSLKHLEALRDALKEDDDRLLIGGIVSPPPLDVCKDWEPDFACAVGFCAWQAEGLKTVEEVSIRFAALTVAADLMLRDGNVDDCTASSFLHEWDSTRRDELAGKFLPLVEESAALARSEG